jgi:hypothetical protein
MVNMNLWVPICRLTFWGTSSRDTLHFVEWWNSRVNHLLPQSQTFEIYFSRESWEWAITLGQPPSESVANWSLTDVGSHVNEKNYSKRFPQTIQDNWVGNTQGFRNRTSWMKRLFIQQCQNSDVKKVNWWPAGSRFVMPVFAFLPNRLAPPPDAPLALSSVSELCLETCMNVFRRDVLFADKLNENSLIVLYLFNENCKRMDFATIIPNIMLIWCRCDSLFRAAQ